ncbi:MAG: hypothetical protein WCV81_04095 [Microgenomates group bacterium]|jgi:hypothetical protein
MIKHIWSVLCQKSSVDQLSNNISLFDVFEALEVDIKSASNVKPTTDSSYNVPVQYQVVTLLSKDTADSKDTQYSIRITLVNPEEKEKILVDQNLTFLANKKRMRSINQIQGLPVNKSGDYHFIVELKHEEKFQKVADLPLEVKLNINTSPKQA